ncbi:MAG: type II secretion system protein [Planctomycetota bacterium]|jgi:prepilin-type N-terminal cleavage/methylation domain-containing protein
MTERKRGFTLIEVLVVISILGVLMGLVTVLVQRSGSHRMKNDAKMIVETYLPNLIRQFEQDFSRLPPMTVAELNGKYKAWKDVALAENQTNTCNEVLLVALRHPDFKSHLGDGDLPGDEPFGNTDGDIFNVVPAGSSKPEAMEILDPWGTPIIYIHKTGYNKESVTIMNAMGDIVEVEAIKKADGTFYNATTFQVISLGPDGKLDDTPGMGDDIYSFKVETTEE